MISPRRSVFKIAALACLFALLLFFAGGGSNKGVRAEAIAQPPYQDGDDYPSPQEVTSTPQPEDPELPGDYPAGGAEETTEPGSTGAEDPAPTDTPAVVTPQASSTAGAAHTQTPPSSPAAAEEDTPPAGTALVTSSPGAGAASSRSETNSGFSMDWGLFWIGFSVPVLVGCGVVLYLMDRQPSLFTKRPKK